MAQPITVAGVEVGNRWCIHPMEGWDANRDGTPSPHTLRRWQNFGRSGAKLIWGGEAAAVRPDGRANPNQTLATEANRRGLAALLYSLTDAHQEAFSSLDGLLVGLQLTHSGRFCKPDDHHKSSPRIAYHHPLLDVKFRIDPRDDSIVWTDAELEKLIDDYVAAARLAHEVGFQFVDVKACHGYLLHEFLSARHRPGRFGGDLEGRSRLLLTIIDRVREEIPQLSIGVRLSVFDSVPYETSREVGRPMDFETYLPYEFGFGVAADNPLAIDLTEPIELLRMLIGAVWQQSIFHAEVHITTRTCSGRRSFRRLMGINRRRIHLWACAGRSMRCVSARQRWKTRLGKPPVALSETEVVMCR